MSTVTHATPVATDPASDETPFTHDDESREFFVGRVKITITRLNADRFRVATTDLHGFAIACWTTEFDPDRIAMDNTVERAAHNFAQAAWITYRDDFETPAQVAARVRAARLAKAA